MAQKFYTVKKGRMPGIYTDWESCKAQAGGFADAVYKGFKTLEEARNWLEAGGSAAPLSEKSAPGQAGTCNAHAAKNKTAVPESAMPIPDAASAIAYVDGSFSAAARKFSYGIVLFINTSGLCISESLYSSAKAVSDDGSVVELHYAKSFSNPELSEMRNVAGEIMGAAQAMKTALETGCKKITIYHDYEGIAKWCLGKWKTNKAWTKKYKDFYDGISKKIRVDFIKVKAHSNVKYNEIADELAKSALSDTQS